MSGPNSPGSPPQASQPPEDPGNSVSPLAASYSNMAAKTVANIRRLQENMAVSQTWSSSLQAAGAVGGQVEQEENCCVLEEPVEQPDNVEICGNLAGLVVRLPSPPPSPRLTATPSTLSTRDPNWQSNKATVRERNSAMYNNSLMADIHFLVGQGEAQRRVPAHRYVLATGSTVFYAMLYGGLAGEQGEEVNVPDVDPEAFLAMLRYLYCDEISLEPDTVLATLYTAKKYIVPHLARECVRFLETSLKASNACLLLSQSRLFEEAELMQRCWDVIDAQAEIALRSEGFTDIDFPTLLTIMQRETLNCSELTVFSAACRWSSAECERRGEQPSPEGLRAMLGLAMREVRFPAMTVQEFADHAVKSDMLNLQEITDIFLNFTAKEKPAVEFPTRPRRGIRPQVCHRFQSSAYRSNQWRYRGRCDSIQFCVDRRIFIVGFGLYGSSNGSADYSVRMELKHGGRVLASDSQEFQSDGSSSTFHVHFDNPVQIEADKSYTASVVLDGAELSYFGQEGLQEVPVPDSKATFQFQCSSESTNGTGVQGGQIPEIIFYGPTH